MDIMEGLKKAEELAKNAGIDVEKIVKEKGEDIVKDVMDKFTKKDDKKDDKKDKK